MEWESWNHDFDNSDVQTPLYALFMRADEESNLHYSNKSKVVWV